MADPAVQYTLSTPAGNITFNDGTGDQIYITDIPDLDDPQIRAPVDEVPFGDGGIIHGFWFGAWHINVEGIFLVTSTLVGPAIQTIRNSMESSLRTALRSIKPDPSDPSAVGTLSWTPLGGSGQSLSVYYEVALRCPHDQDFLVRTFSFGLVSPDSSS